MSVQKRIHAGIIHTIAALVIVPSVWLGALVWYPSPVVVAWDDKGKIIPAQAKAGDWVEIYRNVYVKENFTANITRSFIQKQSDGTILTVEATPVNREFLKGEYKQFRPFKIPCTMTKGNWDLITSLTYLDFLGRTQVLTPPVLKLTVTADCNVKQSNN